MALRIKPEGKQFDEMLEEGYRMGMSHNEEFYIYGNKHHPSHLNDELIVGNEYKVPEGWYRDLDKVPDGISSGCWAVPVTIENNRVHYGMELVVNR